MAAVRIDAVVTDRTRTSARVLTLDLKSADGDLVPEHEAGAHINVLVDQRAPGGALVRQCPLSVDRTAQGAFGPTATAADPSGGPVVRRPTSGTKYQVPAQESTLEVLLPQRR